jgi:hypothetical protein
MVKVFSRYGKLAHRVAVFGSKSGIPGTDRQSVDVAADVFNFGRRQLTCVLATQYSFVIVHVFFPFVSAMWKLAHRIAVVGSSFGSRGTDRQSVDAAGDVINFRRRQLTRVLATQDSVVFLHSLFLSLVRICDCAAGCGTFPFNSERRVSLRYRHRRSR